MMWVVIMFFLVSSSPSSNRMISLKEKSYIIEKTKDQISQKKKKLVK